MYSRRASNTEHPLALGSFRSWLSLVGNGNAVEREFIPRALFVSLSTFATSPLRMYERMRYGKVLEKTAIHPSPIFIVGHWRTGTTHLHNLLCQDDHLGYLTTFQALAPGFCLVGEKRIKPPLARKARQIHPTRIIDNVPLAFDAPQEEEFAVANLSRHSYLHVFSFPQQAPAFFERYALFHGLSEATRAEWTETYLAILRKASFRNGGKRLVLKNPANSGRLGAVLDLFPEAKFIHIYRNPYDVFASTRHLWQTLLPRSQVQVTNGEQIEARVLRFYRQLMQKYLADKARIPAGSLVEVRFEDLEAAPLAQLQRVYERLDLPGFARAEPAFRAYLTSVAGYRKNQYELDDRVIARVNEHWRFGFDEWGYALLEPSPWVQQEDAVV
jgi:hypothetical protein